MNWGYSAFNLALVLLAPLIMIGFGWSFIKKPPKDINGSYGYRTPMSMKNQDTWAFAHSYCGKLWVQCGKVLLAASVAAMLFFLGKDISKISAAGAAVCIAQTVVMVGTLFPVERALKKTFDKDGNRIQTS